MFNEKKFKFDIENLKQDLAIEDMYVTEEDISLLRDYKEQKITEQDMINKRKCLYKGLVLCMIYMKLGILYTVMKIQIY